MTDQQTYSDPSDVTLTIDAARGWGVPEHLSVGITCECKAHTQIHDLVMFVPTARLLAMIDAEDPDAMRTYLRETTEREVPEADSPEDIDEPAVIELTDDIDTRLHVIERLAKILRAGTDSVEVCTLADWVIDR